MTKMNKKIMVPIVFGIAISIILIIFLIPSNQKSIPEPISVIDFSYIGSNAHMKSLFEANGISMSSPLKFSEESIEKYCRFYDDDDRQNSIKHCTSTELKDSDGKFLGNIHMTGGVNSPDTVLGVIQTDPFMSNLDSIKKTYEVMVKANVCDCWQDIQPGKLESVSAWIDAAKAHHLQAKNTTSNSEIDGMAEKRLFLEITTNTNGYLWKFVITN